MRNLAIKMMCMKYKVVEAMKDESGMGVIEIALIILALIAIALLFREKIWDLVTTLMGTISIEAQK